MSFCREVTKLLHRVAGFDAVNGWFLWSELQSTSSISQPAPGRVVSVSQGQAAAAKAQPDSPQMQAASAATGHPAKLLAAAGTSSGGQNMVLLHKATQRKLMVWELKCPSMIPVAQQHVPDAVACWKVCSGDAPPCTGMPDQWGILVAAGAVTKGKPSTCHLAHSECLQCRQW